MRKLKTDTTHSTKEVLIEAGIHLFAKYGYAGTSTRMIATETGMNMNAIQFHFGGKENLYRSVLEHVARDCEQTYAEINEEIRAKRETKPLSADDIKMFIKKLIGIQLYNAIDQPDPDYLALMYWEQMEPSGDDYMPIAKATQAKCEETLSALFRTANPAIPESVAITISRFINGGIMSFGEHPAFLQNIRDKSTAEDYKEHIRNILEPFILLCVEQFLFSRQV